MFVLYKYNFTQYPAFERSESEKRRDGTNYITKTQTHAYSVYRYINIIYKTAHIGPITGVCCQFLNMGFAPASYIFLFVSSSE